MRLTDLRHKLVRTLDGERLGRVFEVHSEGGKVTALMCGPGSFIERLTARSRGRRIPWELVMRIDDNAIVIASGREASAPRSRQAPRRASGLRSRR